MIEQRLPAIARWMLYALGAVEGRRIRRPVDPVAAWLLKQHPGLLPSVPQAALLSTIRARAALVDRMLGEEFNLARQGGDRLCLWTFGAGFDARWFRMMPEYRDVVVEHREVETPALLELKSRLLEDSPYADAWRQIMPRALPEEQWTVTRREGARALVVIEPGAGRLEDEALRLLLQRVRFDAPDARVIVGLPSVGGVSDGRWSVTNLAALGWRVEEDVHLATRGRLMTQTGQEVCSGMHPFRLVRLAPREPKQL